MSAFISRNARPLLRADARIIGRERRKVDPKPPRSNGVLVAEKGTPRVPREQASRAENGGGLVCRADL